MRPRSCLTAVLAALALLTATERAGAGEPPARLRVAAVPMLITESIASNLERILRGMAEAKEAGARIVVFPEAALCGSSADLVSKLDWSRLLSAMDAIAAAADRLDLYVIYGTATRSENGKPQNSAVVLDPGGKEAARQHQMLPESGFEPGERIGIFQIDGAPCALVIGSDDRCPELARLLVLTGARVCFAISSDAGPCPYKNETAVEKNGGWRDRMAVRAAENNVWVVLASPGGSLIVDPGGAVVNDSSSLKDTMMMAEIEPQAATRRNALESLRMGRARALTEASAPISSAPPATRTKLRLALMKSMPVKWDLDANFKVFLDLLERASQEGAELFVTSECWLDGYAAAAPDSTPEKLRSVAQELDSSSYLKRIAAEAERRRMHICFGFTSIEGGKVHNASGIWGADGKRIGVYHKTHLQAHDLQFAQGDSLPVWPTPWGPVGIMICADRRWPETARTLRLKGAKLILNPSYGMCHEANEWWMRTRSYENQCFIAFTHPKAAFIADPKGGFDGKLDGGAPGILVREIDLTRATDDNHLRDRRPELYTAITAPRREE